MQLKDGGLYETKHGKRFRVTQRADGTFTCRSFGGCWSADGRASGRMWINDDYRKPHLVVEVDEYRWVPASEGESAGMFLPHSFRSYDGHRQKRVTRAVAQKIGEEGHARHQTRKALQTPQQPNPTKGARVQCLDPAGYLVWFTWAISTSGNRSVLDIETTSGAKLSIPL